MDPKWLSALRQEQAVKRKKKSTKAAADFHFRLCKEEEGIALRVVDLSGVEVEIDYNESIGYERQLLSTLHQLKQQQDFVIDWTQPSNSIFLHEHPYLLALLRHCPRLENEKGEPITFAESKARMVFQLDLKGEDQLEAKHYLIVNEKRQADFELLTEDMVLWEQQIFEVPPLGAGFAYLSVFNTTISKADEVFFLSLYFSQIDKIKLVYDQYELQHTEQLIEAEPCLVFEKIDVDQSLYLRVGQTLPHIDLDRMQDYPLVRYAQVNELEKRITLRVIRQNQYEDLLYGMERMLQKGRGKQQGFFREDNLFVLEQDCASAFITENLPTLLQSYRVLGAEQLKAYKITVQSPKVSMRLSHGIDFLEGEVDVNFGKESIGLFDLLRQFQKQRYVVLGDGTTAIVDEQYVRRLERLFKQKGKEKDKLQLSVFDLPLIEDLIAEQTDQSPFKRSRAVFEGFADLAKKKTVLPKLNATLRPYQQYGFKWLDYLREQKLGGCLADDMGLGKTLQAISVLAKVYSSPEEKRPSLVVAPRSLLQNWRKECERFAPQLTTHIHYGTDRDWAATEGAQIVITTYATMRNDIKDLKDIDFCYAILDESQNIKNIETQTTRAVLLLRADHRLALSGTPIENNLGELYSLFRFLNPGMFGTLKQFMQDYGYPIQRENDEVATRHLRKKIFPFILRRHKEDVLDDLPDKVEQTLYVDMSTEQAQLYELRRRYYQELIEQQVASQGIQKSQFIIFQALNELRQIATIPESKTDGKVQSAKKELLLEQLWEVMANGRKALIFVNFLAGLELLGNALDEQGIDYVSMSGATRNRQELVDRFQEDPTCRVFLMTLKTGGTGLNLTAASTVFIYDPWWNVAAEKQAIDRTHRIGQVNKVHALRLITVGTIEEKIRLLQEKKQELFDNVIGADGAAAKNITAEDIDFILGK
ncbi:DEAD/DEAH box helicase [Lewinella sp. LCG006]|uniref:DEAD/DEAH box helicase n=1 Tax=Lewinella sp. LCG006 TaxID=3231911 RepID=UPI00346097DD